MACGYLQPSVDAHEYTFPQFEEGKQGNFFVFEVVALSRGPSSANITSVIRLYFSDGECVSRLEQICKEYAFTVTYEVGHVE